jgi:hypothetical protein
MTPCSISFRGRAFLRRNAGERAVFMREMTGGLADEGPALFNYAVAFLDETGELNLLEPSITDDSALRAGPPH